jgi:hypothetical protein
VVRLLDEGKEGNELVLVMELVVGTHFPKAISWPQLLPLASQLFRILHQIHQIGVLHRDLKPGNVLVTRQQEVVILDFGISKGEEIGPALTREWALIGTPAYMAPEQLEGLPATFRSDLYSAGLMLYESLAGCLPWIEEDLYALLALRREKDPPPLTGQRPEIPTHICQLIDQLLSRNPQDRPESAYAALQALGASTRQQLPYLGDSLKQLLHRLQQSSTFRIQGAPGSGRTRLLQELAQHYTKQGIPVAWVLPGKSPQESIQHLITPGDLAKAQLETLLKNGLVLLMDNPGLVDFSSRAIVDALARSRAGRIIQIAEKGDFILAPLQADELHPLFAGPDLILHLAEDASRLLARQSQGLPKAIAQLVETWVSSGLACWEGEQLKLDRAGIERAELGFVQALPVVSKLEEPLSTVLGWLALAGLASLEFLTDLSGLQDWEVAAILEELQLQGLVQVQEDGRFVPIRAPKEWPEEKRLMAHAKLVSMLPSGPNKLRHLIMAGAGLELVEEVLKLAQEWIQYGQHHRAMAALQLVSSRVPERETALLEQVLLLFSNAALFSGELFTLKSASALLKRISSPVSAKLVELLGAWMLSQSGKSQEAADRMRDIAALTDPDLACIHAMIQIRARIDQPDTAETWIEQHFAVVSGFWQRRKNEWLGQIRYRQRRYSEAAALFASSAESEPVPHRKVSAMLRVGQALRDGKDLRQGRLYLEETRVIAESGRMTLLEAHALAGIRNAAYRLGEALDPLEELAELVEGLGDSGLIGNVCLIEGAAAWRNGKLILARKLSLRAAEAWNRDSTRNGYLLANCLCVAAGGSIAMDLPSMLLKLPDFWDIAQCAVLLQDAHPELLKTQAVEEAIRQLDRNDLHRHFILSPQEVYTGWHTHLSRQC